MHSNDVISWLMSRLRAFLTALLVSAQSHVYDRRYGTQTVRTSELCKRANYCSLVEQNILFCRLHYELLSV